VAGVELWYDPRRPAGRRVTRTRLDNGRSIDRDKRYTLAVNSFMATGGTGYDMLRDGAPEDQGQDIDVLVRYLGVIAQPVDAPPQPRLHRVER
jgi:2',3'-cyclic-nucleotide 2'-phosphodiesterase (5'-nucleotidase family)